MELIRPGTYIDFMRYRRPVILVSVLLVLASFATLIPSLASAILGRPVNIPFLPEPNWGIDFRGGTELQLELAGDVSSNELRQTLERLGYRRPDVVNVEGSRREYIIRVRDVSSIPAERVDAIQQAVAGAVGEAELTLIKVSPGGDKISFRFSDAVEVDAVQTALEGEGIGVRSVTPFGKPDDHRYEAHLTGVADEIVAGLHEALGARGPESPRRVEWVGPKAGAQLRDAAMKSLIYAIAFIMVYVAFRFDLRFAPGGVLALIHDAMITVGIYVLVQKEMNLTFVAALLTIVGYSINDTIVVYDRIRENMGRMRDKSLRELINISSSQMLSRTIITSGTTLLSVSAFFIWGTSVIQDIAFALFIGILIGTYSSTFIAAPVTEWMDTKFFSKGR